MKALILNSGLGHRMGVLTSEHPKCMTEISKTETILSRQLKLLADAGIREVVMTTGYFDDVLVNYCNSLKLDLHITFVKNPVYDQTNYIYSIYCAREFLDDDIVMLHGDLVFEASVLEDIVNNVDSCMTISSTLPLPDKDFKAVVKDGEVKAEYTVIIYGDIDCDGVADGNDSFLVNMVVSGMLSADALTAAQKLAADPNHDGKIDAADSALLADSGLLKATVSQVPNA